MINGQRRAIAKKLRELAELIDVAEDVGSSSLRDLPAPGMVDPATQIGGCNCYRFRRGELTGGWLCPVHGRQF